MVKKSTTKRQAQKSSNSELKSNKSTNPKGMASKRALVILFTFFALVAGWLVIHVVRTTYERNQYTHAQRNLSALYGEIVAAVGMPDKTKDDASCGYVSQEFGRGARYCDIYRYFIFNDVSRVEAVKINNAIDQVIRKSAHVQFRKFYSSFPSDTARQDLKLANFSTAGLNDCATDAKYIEEEPDHSNSGFISGKGLSFLLHCSGGSQKEYFPVKY